MDTTCTPCGDPQGQGNTLAAPRRNRYYYGKLLDVAHMAMEQDYGKRQRRLMNRLSVGTGVLCGLDVVAKDGKVCVSGGVALDTFGREIIVPATVCIDPWVLPDECGNPAKTLSREEDHVVQLRLCYRECVTDSAPVQVSDCNASCACEAGTTIESYLLEIVEGAPTRRPWDCAPLHVDPRVLAGVPPAEIPALIRRQLCMQVPHPCAGDADCCVLLAVIALGRDGTIKAIESCGVRTVLYSNAMLLEMILCLAARVEQCCGGDGPPPPPPPKQMLTVVGMRLLDANGGLLHAYASPADNPQLSLRRPPAFIEVTISEPEDTTTVVTGTYAPPQDPRTFSFLVLGEDREVFTHAYVPGTLVFTGPEVVRFEFAPSALGGHALPAGRYEVLLFGDPGVAPQPARPAITSAPPSDRVRLDGKVFGPIPPGTGSEGGTFKFGFSLVVPG
jgi:hypothetical protein